MSAVKTTRIEPGWYETVNAHTADGRPYLIRYIPEDRIDGGRPWLVTDYRGRALSHHFTLTDARGSLAPDTTARSLGR